eukprot:CAMPEP_0170578490 /NCGR_PEP_ID=MMETSP0224-20130122/5481_1 /TAXON_ID=285029 /ORGANISM="Togula jolla, Strain CCCM 725" /LENGTH=515 /DNA_ID=CAMNT_0010901457 /DNA_START=1 /DNA_END=1544 /DNA_ORIENTATION=+
MASASAVKSANVGLMKSSSGYDVTIISTSDAQLAAHWQRCLDEASGVTSLEKSRVIAVEEDWVGGAGNFLGTLYAWQKACRMFRERTGGDLAAMLKGGAAMAMYHTAGKGTRLAPLPGAENNNKPGVKLPVPGCPSILECVMRQTGAYAASRPGRLSVFWGDQIFIPSVGMEYKPQHHVDIICALGPMPSAEEWAQRGLEKYGLIAARADGSVAAMLEKVSHADAVAQVGPLEGVDRVGTSLGSFSLSFSLLSALEAGFIGELQAKAGKMDTDPHVWMPMTIGPDAYAALMVKKGLFDEASARLHHQRVADIIAAFEGKDSLPGTFGSVNIGSEFSWWDYGLMRLYAENSLLLTHSSEDAALARSFFGIAEGSRIAGGCSLGSCQIDSASIVSKSSAKEGKISASALSGVTAAEIKAEEAVLVNVCATKIHAAKGSVLYNIVDTSEEGVVVGENEVRVGVFTSDPSRPYFEMRSNRANIDGGQVFKERVCGNSLSFQEVYDLNHGVDVTACAAAG